MVMVTMENRKGKVLDCIVITSYSIHYAKLYEFNPKLYN